MAERPQGFARRMMAQQLASDARADPFSDSRFFSGKIRPSLADMENPTRFEDIKMPAYQAGATGSLFLPGAGIADYFGKAPDPANPGQLLPGFSDNVQQGNYIDAVMQTGGAAGDVAMAAGALFPPAFPAAAALGTLLKGPRAGRLASGIDNAVDATRGDPNQVAGSATDAAQARYFETGKFEPPTADNPVSIMPPTETEPGIIAFHGSGADFDEFRLEMIGTGEGAQAYGYGLYFTDSEDIAKFYKQEVSGDNRPLVKLDYDGDNQAARVLPQELGFDDVDGYRSYDIKDAKTVMEAALYNENSPYNSPIKRSFLPNFSKTGASVIGMKDGTQLTFLKNQDGTRFTVTPYKEGEGGKMYKVGLAPKPDELLDYDALLSQQPKAVQEKTKGILKLLYPGVENPALSMKGVDLIKQLEQRVDSSIRSAMTQQRFIVDGKLEPALADKNRDAIDRLVLSKVPQGANLNTQNASKISSEVMQELGIPGIKYRAAGSRGAGTVDEVKESNYVIFDDKAVNIMEKYGIVGPVAITAGVAGAARSGNDNEDGGSILPDAGVM